MTEERPVKWGELGYITFARTYSRKKKNGDKETFSDTVERELSGIHKQLKLVLSDKERIPIEVYGLSRLELGMIIRKIGTNFSESLKLATATMIVDEMFDNFGGSANVLDEIEKNIFLEKERNSSTFCFQSLSDDERNRGKQSLLTDRINKIILIKRNYITRSH